MGLADLVGGLLKPPSAGTVPGWSLTFTYPKAAGSLVLTDKDYHAEIDTSLVSGLAPGATTIRLIGIVEKTCPRSGRSDGQGSGRDGSGAGLARQAR